MSDLVSRVLTAIEEAEEDLRAKAGDERHQKWAMEVAPDYNEGCITVMALDGLRHCQADREIVELYRLFRRSGSDDTADALGAVLRLRARAYGISVEEETTGE